MKLMHHFWCFKLMSFCRLPCFYSWSTTSFNTGFYGHYSSVAQPLLCIYVILNFSSCLMLVFRLYLPPFFAFLSSYNLKNTEKLYDLVLTYFPFYIFRSFTIVLFFSFVIFSTLLSFILWDYCKRKQFIASDLKCFEYKEINKIMIHFVSNQYSQSTCTSHQLFRCCHSVISVEKYLWILFYYPDQFIYCFTSFAFKHFA